MHERAGGAGGISSERRPPRDAEPVSPLPFRRADGRTISFVEFVGGGCVEWSVVEVDAAAVPGARAPRCLVFTRQDCIRRVWEYPADWRDLDSAGLTALSGQR